MSPQNFLCTLFWIGLYINSRFHCVRPWTTYSRRNAVYIKEVTPDSTKSKPPLPTTAASEAAHQVPKPPPRSRPKSWTSTLFNAMRNNHRSVTFQCVDEESNHVNVSSEVIVASDPTMPIAAASSSEGQKFYSLPRPNARSRTPSPFRSMIKGLVKGKTKLKGSPISQIFQKFDRFFWKFSGF